MNTTYAGNQTLIGARFASLGWARSLGLALGFSLLTALAAQVQIPLPWTPVPITGQTFAVLLTGALLGSRLGLLAMIAYLVEGASGLPFFRGGNGGVHYLLFSPTAGYLLSYPVAAFVTGWLAERGWDRHFLTATAAMALGSIIILFSGWMWLARFMSTTTAWQQGVQPFLLGDVVKITLASLALPSGWKLLHRKASHKN